MYYRMYIEGEEGLSEHCGEQMYRHFVKNNTFDFGEGEKAAYLLKKKSGDIVIVQQGVVLPDNCTCGGCISIGGIIELGSSCQIDHFTNLLNVIFV